MADITEIDERRIELAWNDYLRLSGRAQRTRDIRDGIAAGKAWAAFLTLFVRKEPP